MAIDEPISATISLLVGSLGISPVFVVRGTATSVVAGGTATSVVAGGGGLWAGIVSR